MAHFNPVCQRAGPANAW